MDLSPLGINRTPWQKFVSVLPYIAAGYLILLVAVAIVVGWVG